MEVTGPGRASARGGRGSVDVLKRPEICSVAIPGEAIANRELRGLSLLV